MIKSKFKGWAFLPILLIFILIASFIMLGYVIFFMPNDGTITTAIYACLYFVLFFFTLVAYWIISEIRKRLTTISINNQTILVGSFYGLGAKKLYNYTEIDGFITSQIPVLYSASYEYLFLIKGGKKVAVLSDFYHSNYAAIKSALSDKIVFLGNRPFNMPAEIKDLF
jgi:hypothetical protein